MNKKTFLGTGWSFPPSFEQANYRLSLNSEENNINQSINLVLQTPRGSRSLLPDFGSDLLNFLFRKIDASLQEEIIQSVKTTLLNDEPRISVNDVQVAFITDGAATVSVTIYYTIKKTNTRHNHVFPFSLLEGTNLQVTAQV